MTEETSILLGEYKLEFENYKSYIDGNVWFDDIEQDRNGNLFSPKLNVESSIVATIISSIKKFKEDVEDDLSSKGVKDFIKFTSNILKKHILRMERYKKLHPLCASSVEAEVKFHSDLFAKITKTKVDLSKLNIDEKNKKSPELFYGNSKAPLLMRDYLYNIVPEVKKRVDALGLDFGVEHINPATSNEMLINMKASDIPTWDPTKHFFEQPISTIQFWEEERKKMMRGVTIGGFKIHPWLYWHLNVFKLAFGAGINKEVKHPDFRDNEYFFSEMLKKAEDHGRVGLFLYGSRRISKSVTMASYIQKTLYTIPNAKCTVLGFTKIPDLKAITDYITESVTNIYPALRIDANNSDVNTGITLGLKGKKVQDRYDFSDLTFINMEEGSATGSQKPAASTPDAFAIDEGGKGDVITPWDAAKPSFDGGENGNWRLVPLISGTAGASALSQSAESMLKDPGAYDLLPMDWDLLEQHIEPDAITWNRQTFGFFVPAQISLGAPPKNKKTLKEFLLSDDPALDSLTIHTTDWVKAKQFFEDKRKAKSGDITLLARETNSYPLDPEDCYMTTESNKFPGFEAKKRKKDIEVRGDVGEKYRLTWNPYDQEVETNMTPSEPTITEYPFKGKSIDSPIVMMENPNLIYQDTLPPLGLYCIGFDDAKQDKTSGDSVLSATVLKRSYEGGEWANRIVAYYDSRPERKKTFYKNLYLMMKLFNARLLHENEDNGYIEWLEERHQDDLFIHVSNGVGLATEENLNRNQNRKWGWSPTPTNIYHLEQRIVRYTTDDNIVIGDKQGLMGVERINHPMLLEELYKYKPKQNADRIRSFGLALTLASYYDKTNQYMHYARPKKTENTDYNKPKKRVNHKGLTDTSKLRKW